jgi:membrane protease YdiL (CAAX protease family)
VEPAPARDRLLIVLLATWAVANGLTHLLLWLTTGKIYYQLSPPAAIAAEASINLLNLVLPVVVARLYLGETSLAESGGWRWTGLKVIWWGVGGFVAVFVVMSLVSAAFQNQNINYGPFGTRPMTGHELRVVVLMLLLLPAAGEEMMFRGFLQTSLTRRFGGVVGLLLPALLFGLRHHPSDIYFGVLQNASGAAWANRLLQLYTTAIVLGIVRARAKSTWASWIVHMGLILLILSLGGLWKFLLP